MPIGYVGGKFKKTKFLYQNCPDKKSYKTLVLNCSGIGWLFLKEDFSHCDRIIFNDINPYLINLLKAFSNPEEFLKVFTKYMEKGSELWLNSQETLKEATNRFRNLYHLWKIDLHNKVIDTNRIDYDAAVQYSYLLSHSFAARHPLRSGFNFRDGNPMYPNFMKVLNVLKKKKYKDLLSKVEYESIDLVECITKYDSEDTFFYIDPPYYLKEADYNVDNDIFGTIGHIRLAEAVRTQKGKVMISYFDFPYLKYFYPDKLFYKTSEDFHKPSCNFKENTSSEKEVIIMNYTPSGIKQPYIRDHKYNKECYFKIAESVAPKGVKRNRSSYCKEFKKIIVQLIKLGVKRCLIMKVFGIGSYSTLKKWEKDYSLQENKLLLAA